MSERIYKLALNSVILLGLFLLMVIADQGMDLFNGTTLSNIKESYGIACAAFGKIF